MTPLVGWRCVALFGSPAPIKKNSNNNTPRRCSKERLASGSKSFIRLIIVEPLYYGHQADRNKCPHYRGVRFREVLGFIWILVSQGLSELSVIERCPF